ncbi:MAG: ABC transporter permease subunit [Planctomycetales bacterium]|nr:ABC transporter permease subunit [Planctomycetales bacterium]MCA9163752.1 ABC transporter permease subunit [Planctomycetales bacterium]MCA9205059.1 ABC transporter permease subunit [Planctomycetales bacterium]MCA9210656.1 ABC transporter permease subunit [Planctomycetales bacterium]MCA9219431.1 ABC transporter permease subunit [Planctomycetales bacterium]
MFLLRRLGWMLITLWVVYTISFALMRAVPGGPFSREKQIPEAIRRNIEARYKLDRPLVVQYFDQLRPLVTGRWENGRLKAWPDFGASFRLEDYTVNEVIAQGFPVSATLAIFALVFALMLGLSAGVVSAVQRHSPLDVSFMAAATLGIAVPNFVLASLAIVLFVFVLGWFPAAGWGTLKQIALPAICLGAPIAAYIARLTRTGMLEVLNRDYIRTAYAKGLHERRVIIHHALRGAILPVVSYLGPAAAGVLTGSIVLEQIFSLPGMGNHFIEAANQRDYTLAMGMILVYTFLLYVMNALVDISYAMIDPRIKLQ